jgi:hypothetical protein
MERARNAGRVERRTKFGAIRAVPTHDLIKATKIRQTVVSDAGQIDAGRCNRSGSPSELNERQNRGWRPDFSTAGCQMAQGRKAKNAIPNSAGAD